jgi:chemotaxis protein MotB
MATQSATPPPIIIVKKKGHGGHHGGAWKVAYADFVTAMMALFIVLWLLNTSDKVKQAVGGYFNDPKGTGKMAGTTRSNSGEGITIPKDRMSELKERLESAMKVLPKFDQMKNNVLITVTDEGLRIELLENEKGMFFETGNANPSESGRELLGMLAVQLQRLPNKLVIEGHTDSRPFSGDGTYSNWELSADRANSARRIVQARGVRPDQIIQVRGFADQRLRTPKDPTAAANRRVSLIVQYTEGEAPRPEVPGHGGRDAHKEG